MAMSVSEEKADLWREGFVAISGWALLMYDSGFRLIYEYGCLYVGFGCLCEGCSVRMAWDRAVEEVFAAEMAMREREDRERENGNYDKEYMRDVRCNRFVFVRRVWKMLMKRGVVVLR